MVGIIKRTDLKFDLGFAVSDPQSAMVLLIYFQMFHIKTHTSTKSTEDEGNALTLH